MQNNATTKKQSFLDKHHFLLRRLHSLTGIFPIGLFLIPHLTTNSSILWGAFNKRADEVLAPGSAAADEEAFARGVATFWKEVQFINELPFLLLIEIALWVSIGYHAAFGVVYAVTGKGNTGRYKYQSNWRYTLQRWTGYIGIFFILYHIATLRWGWAFLVPGGTEWNHNYASATTAAAIQGSFEGITPAGFAVAAFYMLGVTALVFHFANGLWTAAITWGLTVTAQAQKRWGYVCAAVGVGLMTLGWASVYGFATLDAERAMVLEKAMVEQKKQRAVDQEDPQAGQRLEQNPNQSAEQIGPSAPDRNRADAR